ncbi:hypothetical protein [Pedobacter sp. Leaf41]|uniref:hypothetical protein n=1 Tax=Pedobacter sp. Leaf41 TaxID=1736218 RepID=UPI0012FB8E72|nr:hypothetical protein [Pedobacter sp. Leaf41]
MMKVIFTILLILISSNLFAQTYGCLVGSTTSGTVYINHLGALYDINGNNYKTTAPACPRVALSARSGNCYFDLFGTAYPRYVYTLVTTTSSPIACDIDHYAIFALGLIGIFCFIKRRAIYDEALAL